MRIDESVEKSLTKTKKKRDTPTPTPTDSSHLSHPLRGSNNKTHISANHVEQRSPRARERDLEDVEIIRTHKLRGNGFERNNLKGNLCTIDPCKQAKAKGRTSAMRKRKKKKC